MPQNILRRFSRRLQELDWTRTRMEGFFASGAIVRRDVESVYEGLFLRCINSFEEFLENLFIETLLGNTTYPKSKARAKVVVNSRQALWDVLLQGDFYLDWLPYGKTEARAACFLKQGRPFTIVDDGERSKIKQFMLIRNAIAHSSPFAQDQFFEKVVGTLALPPRERTPAGYLRSTARTSPTYLRFQICISDLGSIAAKIATG